jgi:hypothetical protein
MQARKHSNAQLTPIPLSAGQTKSQSIELMCSPITKPIMTMACGK